MCMDTIIRLINLPSTIKGFTVIDERANYNVYINAKLSQEMQKQAINHELSHIKNNDFYSNEHITEIEKRVI